MKVFNDENYVRNLPDAYAKRPNSNNAKLLQLKKSSITALKNDIKDIFNSLDIENATGKTLDLYGEMYGQPRGLATDAQYRFLIRAKIMRNLSSGDYKSVVNAICTTFNCDPSQVLLKEVEDIPLTMELLKLPIDNIIGAGLTVSQTVMLIQSLLPVGVRLVQYTYDGTFKFSEKDWSTTIEDGFANDDGTIPGGYFGAIEQYDDEKPLPIG